MFYDFYVLKLCRKVLPLLWDPHSSFSNFTCIFIRPKFGGDQIETATCKCHNFIFSLYETEKKSLNCQFFQHITPDEKISNKTYHFPTYLNMIISVQICCHVFR